MSNGTIVKGAGKPRGRFFFFFLNKKERTWIGAVKNDVSTC